MNQALKTLEWSQVELHPFQNGVVAKNTISPFFILVVLVGFLLIGVVLFLLFRESEDKIFQTLNPKSDEPVKP